MDLFIPLPGTTLSSNSLFIFARALGWDDVTFCTYQDEALILAEGAGCLMNAELGSSHRKFVMHSATLELEQIN